MRDAARTFPAGQPSAEADRQGPLRQLEPAAQTCFSGTTGRAIVREPFDVLERAYRLAPGGSAPSSCVSSWRLSHRNRPSPRGLSETIDKTEPELLDGALQAADGNKSAAAAALGMNSRPSATSRPNTG